MTKLIQIVDENDQPIGAASKQEAWEKGLIHRAIRIVIEDEQGRILLQKRAPTKQPAPGCWDDGVSGHVDEGESYETAAKREFSEELGLDPSQFNVEELGTFRASTKREWRRLNRFNRVYRVKVTSDLKYHLDPSEASEARWFGITELKQLIKDDPDMFTGGLRSVIERFYP